MTERWGEKLANMKKQANIKITVTDFKNKENAKLEFLRFT